MPEIVLCPQCARKLRIPTTLRGREVRCPTCETKFRAGMPAAPEPAETAEDWQQQSLDNAVQERVREIVPEDLEPEDEPDAPRRRRRPVLRDISRKPSGAGKFIAAFVLLMVMLVGIGAAVWSVMDHPPRVVLQPEGHEERLAEVKEAFAGQKPLEADEIAKELTPMFDGLGEAFRKKDRAGILAHMDFDRMFDELAASGLLPPAMRRDRRGFMRGAELGIGQNLEQQALAFSWISQEIKSIKKLEGNEAVVIVRHKTSDGFTLKMRWWVSKRTGTWRAFDFEDLDAGMRVTTLATSLTEVGPGGVAGANAALKHLQKAVFAIASQRDPDAAERHLLQTAGVKLPKQVDALRSLVKALIHLQRGQFKEALAETDVTFRLHPDMPALDYVKSVAQNSLGEYDKALKHIETYRALLGEDSNICFELAEALRGLQRFAEALAAYRRALDFDGANGEAFLGVVRTLGPDDSRAELAARFAKLDRHHENFDICADDCRQARDGHGLEQIALAMRKIDPDYEPVNYHLALAKLWLGKPDEAAPLFQAALARKTANRQDYLQGYMQAMVDLGKSMEAYAALPDPREAFEHLAAELKQSFRPDEMRRLIARHSKQHAADPLLLLYQGELHFQDGRYALADKTFSAAAATKVEASVLTRFETSRVTVRYHTARALKAYTAFGPSRLVFQQLAQLCLDDEDYDQLQALLDAHAKADPDDDMILSNRMRMAARREKLDDAIATFKAAFAKAPVGETRNRVVSDFLFALTDVGKALEGYQAVPDKKLAFQYLSEDLRDQGDRADLRKLIAVHQQTHPDDPQLQLHVGEMLLDDKQWAEALPIFEAGLKHAPPEMRGMFRAGYLSAMHKLGRGLEAVRADFDKNSFQQLANAMVGDKQAAELEALVEAYRVHAPADPDLIIFAARAKVIANKPAEAVALMQEAWKKPNGSLQGRQLTDSFVHDMHDFGHGLAAYRAVPDKLVAFETLAQRLAIAKKAKDLQQLIDEHATQHPADPWLRFHRGELHLLQGNAALADQEVTAALAQAPAHNKMLFRGGLYRARVEAGKSVATYQEFGADTTVFEALAYPCLTTKNVRELSALVAAHRQTDPDAASLPIWDLEIHWLKQEYDAVQKMLAEHPVLFGQPRYRWKTNNYQVRALIKLNKSKEAIAEAERLFKKKHLDSLTLVLAHTASGDVKQALAAMDRLRPTVYFVDDCYRDADLGPLLRGASFADFRAKFPPPKE